MQDDSIGLGDKIKEIEAKEPIRRLKINDCNITILGTAHISQRSIDAVDILIQYEKPDMVCVELCQSRLNNVRDPEHWKKLDIFKVFKERKMYLLLSNLILSAFQKKMGKGEVKPGDELRKAVTEGEKIQSKIIPIDREIQITLKRAWGNVGFFSRMYLFSALLTSLFVKEEVTTDKIEEMKSEDMLKDLFSQLPARYNQIKNVIIDERDQFLAENIRKNAENSKQLFAVVGAGHLEGIMKCIETPRDIEPLNELPKKTFFQYLQFYLSPLLLIGLILTIFYKSGAQAGTEFLKEWIILKASLAALGAIIALAHPLSIIVAALSAPLGTFIPIFKPGWTAALVESFLRKPLVEDFQNIATDTERFSGYWKNRVIRTFLVFTLPQIGSSIGTFMLTYKGLKGLF